MTAKENNTVILPCKVNGYPPPSVTWSKNNGVAVTSVNKGVLTVNGLLLVDVHVLDTGNYTCKAESILGVQEKVVELIVKGLTLLHVHVSLCLSISLSFSLCVCLSLFVSVCLSVCLCLCLSLSSLFTGINYKWIFISLKMGKHKFSPSKNTWVPRFVPWIYQEVIDRGLC